MHYAVLPVGGVSNRLCLISDRRICSLRWRDQGEYDVNTCITYTDLQEASYGEISWLMAVSPQWLLLLLL